MNSKIMTIIIENTDGSIIRKDIAPVNGKEELLYIPQSIKVTRGGAKFRVVQRLNDKETLLDELIVQRQGNDLTLIYANGVEIQLEGFYTEEGASVFLPAGEDEVFELTAEAGSIATDGNVSTV